MRHSKRDIHVYSTGFVRRARQRGKFILRHKGRAQRQHPLTCRRHYRINDDDIGAIRVTAASAVVYGLCCLYRDGKLVRPDRGTVEKLVKELEGAKRHLHATYVGFSPTRLQLMGGHLTQKLATH